MMYLSSPDKTTGKVTIKLSFNYLGASYPSNTKLSKLTTKKQSLDSIKILYAGRVAEELIFGKDNYSDSCGNDLLRAKHTAERMVLDFGMSEELGAISYRHQQENLSEAYKEKVDATIEKILHDCEAETKTILEDNMDKLHALANGLLQHTTLKPKQVINILEQTAQAPETPSM